MMNVRTLTASWSERAQRRGTGQKLRPEQEDSATKPWNLDLALKATERVKHIQTGSLRRLAEGKINQEEGCRGRDAT